jgi:hypothetical protein
MKISKSFALTLAFIGSGASAMEPVARGTMCNNLAAMMYVAASEARNRLDRDIYQTRTYHSAVTLENPEEKAVWGPYFAVAQKALNSGKNEMSAAQATKTYCVDVN